MDYKQEYFKCYTDKTYRYFIENYLSTFNADVVKETPLKLFPRQVEFVKSLRDFSNTIAIKHRQAGITTVASAWSTGKCVFANPKAPETILCIGNQLETATNLVGKIAAFLDQVPRWMWGKDYFSPDPDSPKNIKSIYKTKAKQMIELFNGCKIYARSSGVNAARGISAVSILIFDEAAMIENGPDVYSQAVACTSSFGDKARIIMISTPKGKDQLYYTTYAKALKGENGYHPVEFKWFQDPRYNRFLEWYKKDKETGEESRFKEETLDSRGNINYNEEHWRDMERDGWIPTSPWYISMCKKFNMNQMLIDQELNVSFLGSSNTVVSAETIEAQREQNVVKITEGWPYNDPLLKETWIWELPREGHRYILGVDNSSGSSDDFTAIQILDIDAIDDNTGTPYINQVLEYNGKLTGDMVGQIVFKYGTTYNNALVVVEDIGGWGSSTILTLMSMKYPNLYYDDPGLKTPTIMRKYEDYRVNTDGKLPGFHTSNVRAQMITKFVELINNNGIRIRSERVIQELETWVFKNGRIDHMDGYHDDLLTCLAMSLYVMEFYMLKNEKFKKIGGAMMSAWIVGAQTSKGEVMTRQDRVVNNAAPNHFQLNPFRDYYRERDNNVMKGCMLLGGFIPRR